MKKLKEGNHENEYRSSGSSPPTCKHCGKRIPKCRIEKGRRTNHRALYCSVQCREAARGARALKLRRAARLARRCPGCSTPIPKMAHGRRKYCSVRCRENYKKREADRHTRELRLKTVHAKKCEQCGGRLKNRRRLNAKFCSIRCKEAASTWDKRNRRRAKRAGVKYEKITWQQIEQLRWKQKHRCACCGHLLPSRRGTGHDCWQIDHIKGIKGGHVLHNLQLLCVPCHREKTVKELGYEIMAVTIRRIRRASKKLTHREVAERFGLRRDRVQEIRAGRTWKWIA